MSSNQNLYPASSPYFNTNVVDNKFLDFMYSRPIPMLPSDVYYEIEPVYEYRPDMLAFDLYSNARLWWVFAARNPNGLGEDPIFNFKAGTKIYIPNINTLIQALGI